MNSYLEYVLYYFPLQQGFYYRTFITKVFIVTVWIVIFIIFIYF